MSKITSRLLMVSLLLGQGHPNASGPLNTVFLAPVTLSSSFRDTGCRCDSGVIAGDSKWRALGEIQDTLLVLDLGVEP